MLTDDDWEPLRAAVPSFAERYISSALFEGL